MINGDPWKSLRKFFVQAFREYGLTLMKDNTAGPVYSSLERTIEDLHKKKGVPFNIIELLIDRCMGTMQKVLFGEDGVTDEKIREMNKAYGFALESMGGINLLLIGPFGRYVYLFSYKS